MMNNKFLIVGIFSTVLGFIAKLPYRKFIYKNNIFDFGLADSLPSFLYIVGIIFIVLSYSKNVNGQKVTKSILLMTSGALLYEFEQLFSNMSFDVKDVIATILGGMFSLALYKFIEKKYNTKTNILK